MIAHAWQILVVALAGWLNQQQQNVVEYLQEENRVLREQLKGKRLRFTDDQRRRLAAKGKALGSKVLREVCTLVTPETVLRWYRTGYSPRKSMPTWRQGATPHSRPFIGARMSQNQVFILPGLGFGTMPQ